MSIQNKLSPLHLWVRHRSAGYLTGRGILWGADAELYPQKAVIPEKYGIYVDPLPHPKVAVCDGNFSVLSDDAFDYVFIGRRLAGVSSDKSLLKEAVRKLKRGGHLIVFQQVSDGGKYTPQDLQKLVGGLGSWILKDNYEKFDHVLQIYKRTNGERGVKERVKTTKPRACIVRYGALGDMIILTPLIKQLHLDGYEVTLNITPYSAPVVDNNPYVDNIVYQEREAIPNPDLGLYWDEWRGEYDRYINLSESLEGTLLKVEGRREFFTHAEWRRGRCNKNYYDFTMQLGGYPSVTGTRGELFFSDEEEREAQRIKKEFKGNYLTIWALNGSSHHKVYGLLEPLTYDWLEARSDVSIMTMGAGQSAAAIEKTLTHPRIAKAADQIPLRISLALTKYADLVVSPETMLANAAGCFATPKITFLSHSSHENLCKYFENDYCLTPSTAISPCYPCHQLHYTRESCPVRAIQSESGEIVASGPACAMGAITGEVFYKRLDEVYLKHGPLNKMDSRSTTLGGA